MRTYEEILNHIVGNKIPVPGTEYFSCRDCVSNLTYGFQRKVDLPEGHFTVNPTLGITKIFYPPFRLIPNPRKLIYNRYHLLHSTTEMANGRYFYVDGCLLETVVDFKILLPKTTLLKYVDHSMWGDVARMALL